MSMMLVKVINLLVRTMAKPLISWVTHYKKMKLSQDLTLNPFQRSARNQMIFIGQKWNYFNTIINRKLFKINSTSAVTQLSEDKALEKGAEFLSEFLVYSILILIPVLEWMRQSRISKHKEQHKQEKLEEMQYLLEHVSNESNEISSELKEINLLLEELTQKINERKNGLI
jgi:hypothetical protein